MLTFCGIIDRMSAGIGRAAMHVYLVVALLSLYEVASRYLMNAPTVWSYEIVLALCALAWTLSGSYVLMQGRHISITLLYDIASPRTRWFLDMISALFTILALAALVYLSWDLASKVFRHVDRSGSAFNAPLPTVLRCLLFAGALLYMLQAVAELLRLVATGPKEA